MLSFARCGLAPRRPSGRGSAPLRIPRRPAGPELLGMTRARQRGRTVRWLRAGSARLAAAAAAVVDHGPLPRAPRCARRAPARRRSRPPSSPLYDLARRVADDRLDVRLILAPGLDPHDYEPRPKDVAGLADASLIFAVGLGLDPWAQGLARSAGRGRGARLRARPAHGPDPRPARPHPPRAPHRPALLDRPRARAARGGRDRRGALRPRPRGRALLPRARRAR